MYNFREQIEQKSKYNFEKCKKNGEVFTPFAVVDEMIASLPKEFFEDKDKVILDPCAGKGQFIAVLIEKFMEGLKDDFENEEECYKHIITNMIFLNEIDEDNIKDLNEIFTFGGKYKLNIKGDFLEENH